MYLLRFWCNSPLPADKHHSTRRWYEVRRVDAMALFLLHHHGTDIGDEIFVGSAFPQQRAKVVIVFAEKAGAQLAVRRQTNTRAMAAEGLRHRRDQPDFAGSAVGKTIFARRFAALVGDLLQR